jgi:hypothetical protein
MLSQEKISGPDTLLNSTSHPNDHQPAPDLKAPKGKRHGLYSGFHLHLPTPGFPLSRE